MEVRIIGGVEVVAPTTFKEIAPSLVGVFACLEGGGEEEEEPIALDLSFPVRMEDEPATVEVASE